MSRIAIRGASPRLNREINKALVLRAIRRHGPISRADVVRATGMNPNTVSYIVEQFMSDGQVCEVGEAPSSGGRPAVLLEINPEARIIIGVEVSEFSVSATLVDFSGKALVTEVAHPPEMSPEGVMQMIATMVRDMCWKHKVDRSRLLGVGVALPGVISPEGDRLVFSMPLDWADLPLKADLENLLQLRVEIINNALAASTYHSFFREIAHAESMLLFIVNFEPVPHTQVTNLGCGIILKGEAYAGPNRMAGEIAVGLAHPLTLARKAGFGDFATMQELREGLPSEGYEAVWGCFSRELVQIVSKGVDLITPAITLICSDLPALEDLIGTSFREQLNNSTVIGMMSRYAHGPKPPVVAFRLMEDTTIAHGSALPFILEFEQMPEL